MLKCWQEERIRRPLFHQIHSILHRVLHHQHFRQQQHHTINDLPLASERYHSMLIDTEKPDYTQTTTIDEWLQSLQLNDLVTLFHIKGFHNLAFLIHTPLTPNALCRLCGITSIKRIECISRSLQQIRSHIFAYYDNLQQQTSSSTEDDEDDDDGEDHVREERKQKSCPYSTNNDMKLNKNFIETTSSSQTEYDCSSDVHLSEVHHPQHNYLLHEQQDSQRISFPYFTTSTGNFV
ncbi:hypothetical protein SNEBB_008861 [Seison nebaliae]|nr:hypothetical protein SNEBB_008861 [Seison nebaliae]